MKTFSKEERLCSKKHLTLLFHKGSSFLLYPYRVTYLNIAHTHQFPAQIVINVAKKRYKLAVHRNLIKRRSREAYRLLKQDKLYELLENKEDILLLIGLQYVGKSIYEFEFLQKKMSQLLGKLTAQLQSHDKNN